MPRRLKIMQMIVLCVVFRVVCVSNDKRKRNPIKYFVFMTKESFSYFFRPFSSTYTASCISVPYCIVVVLCARPRKDYINNPSPKNDVKGDKSGFSS